MTKFFASAAAGAALFAWACVSVSQYAAAQVQANDCRVAALTNVYVKACR